MWPFVRPEVQKTFIPPVSYEILKQNVPEPCMIYEIPYTSHELPKRIALPDAIDSNVYHLFLYMLARFYFFDNGGEIIYYYPKKTNNYLCESALAHLPKRFIRETEKLEGFEYIDMPAFGWRVHTIDEKWIYTYARDLYKEIWESTPQQKGKYTFLSRNRYNAPIRRLLNEGELLKPLKELGFSVYCMENLTFVEQIRLVRSSEFITGVHGAALGWTLFCHPRTLVCEVARPNKTRLYEDMGVHCDLRYCKFTSVGDPDLEKYPYCNDWKKGTRPLRERIDVGEDDLWERIDDDLVIDVGAYIAVLRHLIQTDL